MASAKEIFLNPGEFEAEIDVFSSSLAEVSSVSGKDISNVNKKSILNSMDKMTSIIDTFITCMESYEELANKDIQEMQSMKQKWVKQDIELGNDIGGGTR